MVNVGDTIARDQPVLELETDKATIEVPSSVAGVVKEIKVKPGEKVKVGAVVLTVDEGGENAGSAAAAPGKAAAAKAEAPTADTPQAESAEAQPADAKPADAKPAAEPA